MAGTEKAFHQHLLAKRTNTGGHGPRGGEWAEETQACPPQERNRNDPGPKQSTAVPTKEMMNTPLKLCSQVFNDLEKNLHIVIWKVEK